MRSTLTTWLGNVDLWRQAKDLQIAYVPDEVATVQQRRGDVFIALVGELFRLLREDLPSGHNPYLARIGDALSSLASDSLKTQSREINVDEAKLFAAAAYYAGGYPASAYVEMRSASRMVGTDDSWLLAYELLVRPTTLRSQTGIRLVSIIKQGEKQEFDRMVEEARDNVRTGLDSGPDEFIVARIVATLLARLRVSCIREVLPDGYSERWSELIESMLNRNPPQWEFFPSQMDAIQRGLIDSSDSFSLQMPTGSGKTALCEILTYSHLKEDASNTVILLVPFRALASELKKSVVKRFNAMKMASRCAYGGRVPSASEVESLEETRFLVATPEALSGLLGTEQDFYKKVSLVICDEGHLLDDGNRGVGLELLLARMLARAPSPPRMIFLSAIIPNISEINSWLGGTEATVVRTDYRPALAEFGLLRSTGSGAKRSVALAMHPHLDAPLSYGLENFLSSANFRYVSAETKRTRTYKFDSIKAQAVAAGRIALRQGAVAIFSANKAGNQGAIGLAKELISQLEAGIPLPAPRDWATETDVVQSTDYLSRQYGTDWIGTQTLKAGAVLHHGDLPQETREVLEQLLRNEHVPLAICTSTLAEGVNLPIRTLVLYSVTRRLGKGQPQAMLARDIKNLVGRAGRAGATTRGLVICANEKHWEYVDPVARELPGEPVAGALNVLIGRLYDALRSQQLPLTSEILEGSPAFTPIADGIDSVLLDLIVEEIGIDSLTQLAIAVANRTFAATKLDTAGKALLTQAFTVRSHRLHAMQTAGKLRWVRATGVRIRFVESIEANLLPLCIEWHDAEGPLDGKLRHALVSWAWEQPEMNGALRRCYGEDEETSVLNVSLDEFEQTVVHWMSGKPHWEIAQIIERPVDILLRVLSGCIGFVLQSLVEQAINLISTILEDRDVLLSDAAVEFPYCLRFGVPSRFSRLLSSGGVRHRSASVALGKFLQVNNVEDQDATVLAAYAQEELSKNSESWEERLGQLVFRNTLTDLESIDSFLEF